MEYYRDEPALTDAGATDNFPGNSAFFKFKQKIRSATWNDDTKMFKKTPLQYLSNFWRIPWMPLFDCEINLILTWSNNCVISNAAANWEITFSN